MKSIKDETNSEIQNLLNNIPGAVARMRYDGGLIVEYANDYMFDLLNMKREEFADLYGNCYDKLIFPQDWKQMKRLIAAAMRTDGRVSMEYRVITRENNDEWRMMQASILENDGDSPILQCVITNINMQKNAQLQLDSLIQHVMAGIVRLKFNGRITQVEYISDRVPEIIGYSKGILEQALLTQMHVEGAMPLHTFSNINKALQLLLEGQDQFTQEHQIYRSDQKTVWLKVCGAVVSRTHTGIVVQAIITDITKSKEAYLALSREKDKLSAVEELSGDMIFEYDIDEDRMFYIAEGDTFSVPTGYTEHYTELITKNPLFQDADEAMRLAKLLRSGNKSFEIDLRRLGEDKKFHWVHIIGKTIFGRNHVPEKVLGKLQDIDEQKEREVELLEESRKDSMTGLFNHDTARQLISERIQKMDAEKEAYFVVCDIDNFKEINDLNGHLFGDSVICSVADEISVLFPNAVKGRIGGDEFVFYVEDMERDELEEQLAALNDAITERFYDERMERQISCSMGAVVVQDDTRDYGVLFQLADSALYGVKNSGKGAYRIFESGKGLRIPEVSYLASKKNDCDIEHCDTLIRNAEELVLSCVELMENIPNITIALQLLSEHICRFYDLDDVVFLEHENGANDILYQWSRVERKEYANRIYQTGVYEWDRFIKRVDEKGVLALGAAQTALINTEEAKSVLLILSKEIKDYQASIVFSDRSNDRDWESECSMLTRIANVIFKRLKNQRSEEREQQEWDRKLNYDALTGLLVYNRFIYRAQKYLDENGKKNVFCTYSDFSNFQYLNEVYGYETGDIVLKEFAEKLKKEYRKGILFCRITSDHFVGFIQGESAEQAQADFLEFTDEFSTQCNKQYDQCNLVIASGLYEVKEEDETVSAMMDNANEARKKCKAQKVVTAVEIYTDKIKQETESVKEIVANVVTAYNNDEFRAYLQPKVSLKTGKVVGAEALVRWVRPDGRHIMPIQFIDICERNGFITKIDFRVFEHVMEYLRDAISVGEEVVPISVNFSRRHNEFEDFVPSIFKRLEDYHVPSNLLEAEVTETIFMSDLDQLNDNISRLRDRGVEISVDDFGSEYSSLNILSKLKADTIKLDRQFLNDTSNQENAFTIVKYLIQMLKHLGFQVLAEGVETEEQVEMLRKADCDLVQGYYYAKPMPISEFRRFLRDFNSSDK